MNLEQVLATLEKARSAIVASPYAKKQLSKAALVRVLNDYSPKAARMTLSEVAAFFFVFRARDFSPAFESVLVPSLGSHAPPLPGRFSPGALRGKT